ncbi:MAG: aldehyde dehydrogenase (NADP(+)) [Acidobacteria bacterium]|nr:MAG: aldehyde dehydrogenase (NADP(+)) [Acidobacteriota bacterium]
MAAESFQARNPATGEWLDPVFHSASAADLERAAAGAAAAAPVYARCSGRERGAFLRAIAAHIEAAAPQIVARAGLETALPAARLQGESARTTAQLRMFAELIEEGSWVDARLDTAVEHPSAPRKPDLRSMLHPLGPVAVFGSSNFPLAFSVAGGDTTSALAGGNPVIVKAHPAHPGTSALVADAIRAAAAQTKMPEGVFSLLFDSGIAVGAALVQHPAIRAVGFTGSLQGGRKLMDLAAARPEPIPVYAEMGSVNPVFILPHALAERAASLAAGLVQSVTLGAGQFCTKPGLVLVPQTPAGDAFLQTTAEQMAAAPAFTLLTESIARSFRSGAAARAASTHVKTLAHPANAALSAWLFETTADQLLQQPHLGEELFGPATLAVRHGGKDDLLRVARSLGGHLTATLHATDDDLRENSGLIEVLTARVGRLVINGFPTGVAVTSAMVHGGPYPASSLPQSSVGTRAIVRFVRPVCYQDMPAFALPDELKDANPLRIWRLKDGNPSRD